MKRVVSAESEIAAPIERVWSTLVDVARYPEWNPFTFRVETTFALGSPVAMHVRLWSFTRLQVEYVSAFEPPHRVCWGAPFVSARLLRAERCQTLEALSPSRTRYRSVDVFEGPLAAFAYAVFGGPVERGFREVAEALKMRCEAT